MNQKYGYWIDLGDVELSEGDDGTSWLQAFPEGTYHHPLFGEMNFDADKLNGFAKSVKSKVRGIDPDIDYDHKMHTGEAAGWVKAAEYRPGEGLHLNVAFTPKARAALANKEYRYFSPEFADEWTHPQTEKVHKNVLFGGALTNRPFLKDLLPVNLSELLDEIPPQGDQVDPKELRRILGLAEDATDETVAARSAQLIKLQEVLNTPPTDDDLGKKKKKKKKFSFDDDPTPKSTEELLAQLSDIGNNPAVAALAELVKAQQAEIIAGRAANREIEVDRKLYELDKGKKFAVPPAVKEQLRHILMNSPKELSDEVLKAYKSTIELGVVDLTERGWQRKGENLSPTDTLNREVSRLMEADKNLTYRDAYVEICKQRPELAAATRQDSYIKDGA
jgi:phage I-like protein